MKESGKLLLISGVTGEVERIFQRAGIDKAVGEENIFSSDTAVLKSTKHALQRALDYVNSTGEKPYRVRLFYSRPEKEKL